MTVGAADRAGRQRVPSRRGAGFLSPTPTRPASGSVSPDGSATSARGRPDVRPASRTADRFAARRGLEPGRAVGIGRNPSADLQQFDVDPVQHIAGVPDAQALHDR
jgi:hypothetical protein